MNPTLVAHTVIQRALSPARMFLVLSIVGFPALVLSFAPAIGFQMLQSGAVLGMVLGAGVIGQDASAGVLQLLFARPVSRAEYVLSRWFAAGACATAAVLVQVALGGAIMTMRGAAPGLDGIVGTALEQSLAAFGIVSVITLLSSFLPGVGDLMAWLVLNVAGGVMQMIAAFSQKPWFLRATTEWVAFLNPKLVFHDGFGTSVSSWTMIVAYASTVTLCLALAIVILNRRELSYATE